MGEPRGVVPAWAAHVTASVDAGRHACYWQADAWDADWKTSCLLDQGLQDTDLNRGGEYKMTADEGTRTVMVQEAIQRALTALRERFATGWMQDRVPFVPRIVGVDCGGTADKFAWYEVVLRFCAGVPYWVPLKGSGWSERTADRALARNWICEEKGNPGRRHDCNADHFKTLAFNALAAPVWHVSAAPPSPGAPSTHSVRGVGGEGAALFSGTRILHKDVPREYCRQMTSEKWVEVLSGKLETPSGKELKVGWNHVTSIPNHWWDTNWMAFAVADIARTSGLSSARDKPQPGYTPREPAGGAGRHIHGSRWKIGR